MTECDGSGYLSLTDCRMRDLMVSRPTCEGCRNCRRPSVQDFSDWWCYDEISPALSEWANAGKGGGSS